MIDIWIVSENDMVHGLHMTPKGAYVEAFSILSSCFELNFDSRWCPDGEQTDIEQDLMEISPALRSSVTNTNHDWGDERLDDMSGFFDDFRDLIGEWTDWATDVKLTKQRLQI